MDKWFQLPWIGKDTYADLKKAKVRRDSKFGFKFASDTNASRALCSHCAVRRLNPQQAGGYNPGIPRPPVIFFISDWAISLP